MIKRVEQSLLRWLRVPHEPTPPAGAPGSLRVFRAGRNYMRLKFVAWMGAQLAAIWGLLVSLYFIQEVEYQLELDAAREVAGINPEPEKPKLIEVSPGVYETEGKEPEPEFTAGGIAREITGGEKQRRDLFHRLLGHFVPPPVYEIAKRTPPKVFFWIKIGETIGLVIFLFQFFWSLAAIWLDFNQRWYMVTDRSLRLRWGILKIQETTMSFANLQQVSVKQGPLQRLLKLADVEVQSAGGGSSGNNDSSEADSMHRSTFHAVENASEIRDLIVTRLKRFRQSGLGEPDDPHQSDASTSSAPTMIGGGAVDAGSVEAARLMLAEVRALRATLPQE
ncbi:PH domain-containing protein [Synoicihabitans lomoniglobus]|uniref:PH domain-containing protein n=1 Tax=Synoicihabitans lomoniglobus TaxID=2909285 RepID=A0AAE9ZVH0_9BACT|nr:PH domain-containing protein [Opitutaceae bacterium LMO-M01]WED64891.1 PH domain-containing protein [Opitutaceae bacterium LMO-M01]